MMPLYRIPFVTCCIFVVLVCENHAETVDRPASGTKAPPEYHPSVPEPTLKNIRYGPHQRHVLDFWKASSTKPTPVVLVIHGGGWKAGSKERLDRFVNTAELLKAGVSVVAINYRLIEKNGEIDPPVKAPMDDAARALQFVRSMAADLNISVDRIGAAGGSAGACTSLWLAYRDDLADPESSDAISRESTRLRCVAVRQAQTTLDPVQMKEWTPNIQYGGDAFGMKDFASFLAERESILSWIEEYSPYALVSTDDPPTYLEYNNEPSMGMPQKDPTHTSNFGVKLQERCNQFGVACELVYPGAPDIKHESATEFLIANLVSTDEETE